MAKGKGGRPSKYDNLDLKQVEKLAKLGWTDVEMAGFFSVDVRTWYNWKGKHNKFFQALKEWKQSADERVERSLYERAIGYSYPEDKIFQYEGEPVVVPTIKHEPPSVTAQIYWLKNRQPDRWRDKKELEHSGEINLASLIDEARERVNGSGGA